MLEKTSESPLANDDIKPVNLKGNQPWILIKRSAFETEAPVFLPSNVNSWFIGKVPDAGEDWGQEKKWTSEDEMVGWDRRCNGHELGQTLGEDEGQGVLACCSPQSCKESDTTGWLNNNEAQRFVLQTSSQMLLMLLRSKDLTLSNTELTYNL